MGIWKQRIDESWLKCTGQANFRIINMKGGTDPSGKATAISLKHSKIDATSPQSSIQRYLTPTGIIYPTADLDGFMNNNIGTNTLLGDGIFSYVIDYYFGPSINSTKIFSFKKNYQFKTHVYNYAYAANRSVVEPYLNVDANHHYNGRPYNSSLSIFKGALGINPTWEDSYYFDVPYYKDFNRQNPLHATMYVLYYYSSPKSADSNSGFVAFTNKLESSKQVFAVDTNDNPTQYKLGLTTSSTSVYQAGYGIGGLEINEIGWKIQGYSFVSYDNDPNIGVYSQGLTNSYTGDFTTDSDGKKTLPNRLPLKRCLFGKG